MELTKEQMDIKQAAREFAEGEFRERAKEFDEKEEFDLAIWKRACEFGFVGTFIEEEYGGAGLGFSSTRSLPKNSGGSIPAAGRRSSPPPSGRN